MPVLLTPLGQTGFRFDFGGSIIFVDPYLSDYVEELEGADHGRLFSAPLAAESINDAGYVCITHIHADHCDPRTLNGIYQASPTAVFFGPSEVVSYLLREGMQPARVKMTREDWYYLGGGVSFVGVPAAHPLIQRDSDDSLRYLGYVFEFEGRRFYHAGDTAVTQLLIDRLRELIPIDIAFLPVNERNFFREKRGIIGNMTIREAFQFAEEIGIKTLVPTHWDMFGPNSVFREEIELLYKKLRPRFTLRFYPEHL